MKKWLVFLCILLLIFTLILLIVGKLKGEKVIEEVKKEDKKDKFTIEYKANQTIRVRMSRTNEIIAMDINDYLRGVLPAEMPPSYNMEALRAQAIVARTYTYRKMSEHAEGEHADICDDFRHCQAFYNKDKIYSIWTNRGFNDELKSEYWDRVNEAVVSTQNQVIVYNGEYIKAFFHASSPIKTENIDQIWGGIQIPYLISVSNVEYEDYPNRSSQVFVSYSDLENKIYDQVDRSFKVSNFSNIREEVKINNLTTSGRVKDIKFGNLVISAEKLRTLFGLKSTQFNMQVLDDGIIFDVIGYGHGVGMSQVGANYLADNGKSYIDIIKHYYTGVEVITLE